MELRRSVLLLVFAVSSFLLWDAWLKRQTAESAQGRTAATSPAPAAADNAAIPSLRTDVVSELPAGPAAAKAVGASGMEPVAQEFRLVNADVEVVISSQGGSIVRSVLLDQSSSQYDGGKVVLMDSRGATRYEAQTGVIGSAGVPTHLTPFRVVGSAAGGKSLTLTAESGGLRVTKIYTLAEAGHQVGLTHRIENTGATAAEPNIYFQLVRTDIAAPGESEFYQTFTGPAIYTQAGKFEKISFNDIAKGRRDFTAQANDGWLAMVQHYFVSAWVPSNADSRTFYTRTVSPGLYSAGFYQPTGVLAPGAQVEHASVLYTGPQVQEVLADLAPGLDLVVDYSWLTFLAKPIYWLLKTLYGFVSNWGWSIVLLTVLIKLLLYPLSAAGYKSMARMKEVTPRMMALRERYANDKAKLNQAVMELYKNEKINPLGGCLPVVVQIPVFLALYWVLLASVEMRNAPWMLWIVDLSEPDPYFILPVVMAVTMYLQTFLNPPPPDPLQAKVMKFMPLIFSAFFFFFPAGLVLYWLVNNVLSIAQQWFVMRRMGVAVQVGN